MHTHKYTIKIQKHLHVHVHMHIYTIKHTRPRPECMYGSIKLCLRTRTHTHTTAMRRHEQLHIYAHAHAHNPNTCVLTFDECNRLSAARMSGLMHGHTKSIPSTPSTTYAMICCSTDISPLISMTICKWFAHFRGPKTKTNFVRATKMQLHDPVEDVDTNRVSSCKNCKIGVFL